MPRLGYKWQIKPPLGAHIDRSHPLASGLIAYLPMNEGGGSRIGNLAAPSAPNSLPASLWTPGSDGPSLLWTNSTAYSSVNLGQSFTYPVTVACSIQIPASANNGSFRIPFGLANTTGYYNGYYGLLCFGTAGQVGWYVNNGTTLTSGYPVSATSWTQLVLVCTSTTSRALYANGVLVHTDSTSITPAASVTNLMLGDPQGYSAWGAQLAWGAAWNRALTAGEITGLYEDPYGLLVAPTTRRFWATSSGGSPAFLAGTVSAAATAAATLTAASSLVGSVSSGASATASLAVSAALSGAVDGAAAANATLTADAALAGSITVITSVTGQLAGVVVLSPRTLAATLTVTRSITLPAVA